MPTHRWNQVLFTSQPTAFSTVAVVANLIKTANKQDTLICNHIGNEHFF